MLSSPETIEIIHGEDKDDFFGFAIEQKPKFDGKNKSWLPNIIGFSGPVPEGKDLPSNQNLYHNCFCYMGPTCGAPCTHSELVLI